MGIGFEEKEAIADEDFWLAVEGIMPVARVFCFLQGLSESCELTSGMQTPFQVLRTLFNGLIDMLSFGC